MRYYKFRNEETEPRTFIEIHPASRLKHLLGCLAPCMSIAGGDLTADPIAVNSSLATRELLHWFGDNSWVLKLTS